MTHKPVVFILHFIAAIVVASAFSLAASAEEQCLANAWKAFNTGQHTEAVKYADECITQFETTARQQQSAVLITPPCGKVSDQEKASIHQRGLLNDVATAAWVKSKSAAVLGKTKTATKAKKLTCKLKHGRTWDPKGWFWAPCEGPCP